MASTPFLITVIIVSLGILLAIHAIARRFIDASLIYAPKLVSQVAGSPFWASGAPIRTRLAARFPRVYGFAAERFSVSRFAGLPLTLMALAGLYMLASLGGLIDDVRETEGLVSLDQGVNAFFAPYRTAWLLAIFVWITAMGAGPSLTALVFSATALLWSGGRGHLIVPLWVTFLGAQATTWTSKYIIARPRPIFLPAVTEWNPSFPSGHATASTALIGFLGYAVARNLAHRRERFEVAFWTIVIIALICFSRLFLSLHFLSDVLAGILVGTFWLLVGFTVAELGNKSPPAKAP